MIADLGTELDRPLTAMIELSDHCNEVCVHCYQVQGRKGEMTTPEVFQLLEQLAAAGVLLLTLSGGEVLLRKDFFEIAARARGLGFALRVFTNGLLVDAEVARRFAELAVQTVEISIYSPVAETHDFVTGVPGSHEKTMSAIRALRAHNVPVVIKSPLMSVNAHQVADYERLGEELGARVRLSPGDLCMREDGDETPWQLNAEAGLLRGLLARNLREVAPVTEAPRDPDSRSCGAGLNVHVEPDGQLRPCTLLELDLGHVRDGVQRDSSQSQTALRELLDLRFRDFHGCRDCDLAAHCGRCYANALAETGDALGPHRSACKLARTRFEAALGRSIELVGDGAGAAMGPYRRLAEGRYEVIPDRITPEDDALARRLGWVRRAPREQPLAGLPARPGELVQLRRPGQRSVAQRVPLGRVQESISGRQQSSVGRAGGENDLA